MGPPSFLGHPAALPSLAALIDPGVLRSAKEIGPLGHTTDGPRGTKAVFVGLIQGHRLAQSPIGSLWALPDLVGLLFHVPADDVHSRDVKWTVSN